jgi:hypothetical protein
MTPDVWAMNSFLIMAGLALILLALSLFRS